jgi:GTP-binding protein LepA
LAVINKVDLPHAAPVETSEQIVSSLGLEANKHMHISAKSGLGVDQVLNQIIDGLPSPQPWKEHDGKLRGLVFDHLYVYLVSPADFRADEIAMTISEE